MKKYLICLVGMIAFLSSLSSCKDLDKMMEMPDLDEMKRRIMDELLADSLRLQVGGEKITECNDTTFFVSAPDAPNDSVRPQGMMVRIMKVKLENHDYWLTVGVGENKGGLAIAHSESCPNSSKNDNSR